MSYRLIYLLFQTLLILHVMHNNLSLKSKSTAIMPRSVCQCQTWTQEETLGLASTHDASSPEIKAVCVTGGTATLSCVEPQLSKLSQSLQDGRCTQYVERKETHLGR